MTGRGRLHAGASAFKTSRLCDLESTHTHTKWLPEHQRTCTLVPKQRVGPIIGCPTPEPEPFAGCKILTQHKLADTDPGHGFMFSADLRSIDLEYVVVGEGIYLQTASEVIGARQQVPLQLTVLDELSYSHHAYCKARPT